MSFAELMKKQGKEKDDILNSMSDDDYARYEKFLKESRQVANQEEKKLDRNIQVANQRKQTEIAGEKLAIEKINKQVPEIVQKMEMILER